MLTTMLAVQRCWYAASNYLAAQRITELPQNVTTIFVDRFLATTVAYSVGFCDVSGAKITASTGTVVPHKDHQCFVWPADLPQPALTLLLECTPAEREQRVRGRGEALSWSEEGLQDGIKECRTSQAYRNVSNANQHTAPTITMQWSSAVPIEELVAQCRGRLSIADDEAFAKLVTSHPGAKELSAGVLYVDLAM